MSSYEVTIYTPKCPTCGHGPQLFEWNFGFSASRTWRAAGLDLDGWTGRTARNCVAELVAAVETMEGAPERFRGFITTPGCGTYDELMPALRDLLAGFRANPDGVVAVVVE